MEIGSSLLAMLQQLAVNIGIDSLSTFKKGTAIINHERKRQCTKIKEDDGTLLYGGEASPYHRESPWKKCGD